MIPLPALSQSSQANQAEAKKDDGTQVHIRRQQRAQGRPAAQGTRVTAYLWWGGVGGAGWEGGATFTLLESVCFKGLMVDSVPPRSHAVPVIRYLYCASAMTQHGFLLVLFLSLLLLSAYGWQLQPSQPHLFRPTPSSSSSSSSSSSFYHSTRHALAPRRRRLSPLFSTFPPLSPGDALNGGEAEKEGKGGGGGGEGDNNTEDGKNEEELAAFLNLRKNDRGGTPIDR